MNIGEKIRKLRIENNLKQSELGDKLFISEKTISSWENGRTVPDISMLYNLSNIFNVSFLYLIDDSYSDNTNDEISIRLKVDNTTFKNIEYKINNKSNKSNKLHQIDKYYKTSNNNWLRIRNENGKYILNFKEKIDDHHFSKYDVQIDNIDNMSIILNKLGLKELGIIDKLRETYKIDIFIINFDDVLNIGKFIEIKLLKNDDINKIIDLLNELNIDMNMINMKKYIDYIL